jgi:hypothetical protein
MMPSASLIAISPVSKDEGTAAAVVERLMRMVCGITGS